MPASALKRLAIGPLHRLRWHPSLTTSAIVGAVERHMTTLDSPGFCLACGHKAEGVDPDARNFECEACGAEQMFGAEELLMEVA